MNLKTYPQLMCEMSNIMSDKNFRLNDLFYEAYKIKELDHAKTEKLIGYLVLRCKYLESRIEKLESYVCIK